MPQANGFSPLIFPKLFGARNTSCACPQGRPGHCRCHQSTQMRGGGGGHLQSLLQGSSSRAGSGSLAANLALPSVRFIFWRRHGRHVSPGDDFSFPGPPPRRASKNNIYTDGATECGGPGYKGRLRELAGWGAAPEWAGRAQAGVHRCFPHPAHPFLGPSPGPRK